MARVSNREMWMRHVRKLKRSVPLSGDYIGDPLYKKGRSLTPISIAQYDYPVEPTEVEFFGESGTAYIGSLGIVAAIVLAVGVFAYFQNTPG